MRRVALCGALMGAALAASADMSVRAQASSIGYGVELGYRLDSQWGIRAGYLRGDLDVDFEAEDNNGFEGDELQYDSDVDLRNGYVFADWHPWKKRFRVSAGTLWNDSEATIVTRCEADSPTPVFDTTSCEFGNTRFAPAILGEITTDIDFDELAPYVGIGWGHTFESGFALNADLGVAYLGEANVSMRSSGSCNDNESCRQQIKQEENEIREELDDYKLLPMLSLGLSYLF